MLNLNAITRGSTDVEAELEKVTVDMPQSSLSMPPHIPTGPQLDVPIYEGDICDLSPYSVSLSTTINSSYSTTSSVTEHEVVDGAPYSSNGIHPMVVLGNPMRGIFGVSVQCVAISSPTFLIWRIQNDPRASRNCR